MSSPDRVFSPARQRAIEDEGQNTPRRKPGHPKWKYSLESRYCGPLSDIDELLPRRREWHVVGKYERREQVEQAYAVTQRREHVQKGLREYRIVELEPIANEP